MQFTLSRFTASDMALTSAELRGATNTGGSMEEVASRIVNFFHGRFEDDLGSPAFALARLFITRRFDQLLPEQQEAARLSPLAGGIQPDTACLTLLATQGERPEWRSRHQSKGHVAIPLMSDASIERAPMIASMFRQFGVRVSDLRGQDAAASAPARNFDVFHIPRALGSPLVPAQSEFVEPAGVRSVIGFGAMIPGNDLFAAILFSRVETSDMIASLFAPVALSVRMNLVRHLDQVFEPAFR